MNLNFFFGAPVPTPTPTAKYKNSEDITVSVPVDFLNKPQPFSAKPATFHFALAALNKDVRANTKIDDKKLMQHINCLAKCSRPVQEANLCAPFRKRLNSDGHAISIVEVPAKGKEPQQAYGLTHYALGVRQDEVFKAAINLSNGVVAAHSSVAYDTNKDATQQERLENLTREEDIQNLFKADEEFVHLIEAYSYISKSGEKKRGRISEFCHSSLRKIDTSSEESRRKLALIFLDILSGMKKMANKGIVHGALKPENIMLQQVTEEHLIAKIGNFSSALPEGTIPAHVQPLLHMSPEFLSFLSTDEEEEMLAIIRSHHQKLTPLIQNANLKAKEAPLSLDAKASCEELLKEIDTHKKRFDLLYKNPFYSQLDIWSFGVLAYEILFKDSFYHSLLPGKSEPEIIEIVTKKMRRDLPAFQNEIRAHLAEKTANMESRFEKKMIPALFFCLDPDPCSRANAQDLWQLLNDTFFPAAEKSEEFQDFYE